MVSSETLPRVKLQIGNKTTITGNHSPECSRHEEILDITSVRYANRKRLGGYYSIISLNIDLTDFLCVGTVCCVLIIVIIISKITTFVLIAEGYRC